MPLDRHLNWTPTSGTVCSTHWATQILSWFLDESTHINAFTQLCGVLVFLQFGQVTNCSKPRLKVGCEFDWAADRNYRWKKSSKPEEKRSCLCSLCRKLSEVEACHRNEQGTAYVAIFIHLLNQVIEYPRENHHFPFRVRALIGCLYYIRSEQFTLNTQHHKGLECGAKRKTIREALCGWRLTHFNISHTCFEQIGCCVIWKRLKQNTCNCYHVTVLWVQMMWRKISFWIIIVPQRKSNSIMVHAVTQHTAKPLKGSNRFLYWRQWCSLLKCAGLTSPTDIMNQRWLLLPLSLSLFPAHIFL